MNFFLIFFCNKSVYESRLKFKFYDYAHFQIIIL